MGEKSDLEGIFRSINRDHIRTWLPESSPHFEPTLAYSVSRYAGGREMLSILREQYSSDLARSSRILDVGGGNGGIILPFVETRSYDCHTFDLFCHAELRRLLEETNLPLSVVVARGEDLPYPDETFRLVLYIETIEHVSEPSRVGKEICRVLKPGGLCLVTTPPRIPFLLHPDPHYHVRGLVALPNSIQRWIVERVARKGTTYEVSHIYWSVWGIMRKLPGMNLDRVFTAVPGRLARQFNWSLIVARKQRLNE